MILNYLNIRSIIQLKLLLGIKDIGTQFSNSAVIISSLILTIFSNQVMIAFVWK